MRRIGGEGGGGGRARRSSVLHPILNRAGQALGRLQFDLKDIAAVPAICFSSSIASRIALSQAEPSEKKHVHNCRYWVPQKSSV